jgi:hypothetical protein
VIHNVSIYDVSGRQVTSFPVKGDKNITVSENLSPGLYLIQLKADTGVKTKKIIVE